jgi:hypothetical protein
MPPALRQRRAYRRRAADTEHPGTEHPDQVARQRAAFGRPLSLLLPGSAPRLRPKEAKNQLSRSRFGYPRRPTDARRTTPGNRSPGCRDFRALCCKKSSHLSLSQTLSGWQLIENRAMLLRDERSCQAHCLDGRRSVSVAGSARGGNSDVAAADKRSAANRRQETNLQLHRPIDFCLPLSASPWRSRCAGECQAGDRSQMASRWLPFILAQEIEGAGWQANSSVGDTQAYPRDEHCQSSVGSASDPWRTPQARRRYRTDQRGQVHGRATRPAIPRLEDIPPQPC